MAQQSTQPLEDQLRSMILNNVPNEQGVHKKSGGHGVPPIPRGGHRPLHPGSHPGHHHAHAQHQRGYEQRLPHNRGRGGFHDHPRHHPDMSHHQPPPPAFNHAQYPQGQFHGHHGHYGNPNNHSAFLHDGSDHRFQADPDSFQRGSRRGGMAQHRQPRQLYQPQHQPFAVASGPQFDLQRSYLNNLLSVEIPLVEMSSEEVASKDSFRVYLEDVCKSLRTLHPDLNLPVVTLSSFGSFSSGFASAGSDMDLAIVTDSTDSPEQQFPLHEHRLPRALEKALLDRGFGARLLTRTRVPIIKICELPTPELLHALREEHERWATLPEEEKYSASRPDDALSKKTAPNSVPVPDTTSPSIEEAHPAPEKLTKPSSDNADSPKSIPVTDGASTITAQPAPEQNGQKSSQPRNRPQWTRERAAGPLDFPKDGVGIQCDINFSNPLGLHNTKLLRCYSKCDQRVRPMVLFVKAWAKRRKINSSYSGTLSSYGYVLMVLHYLVNVATPPVLPNLQLHSNTFATTTDGWEVRFYGDEDEIASIASRGQMTSNQESLGALLRGFFQYFASTSGGQGFIWMQDVLSLRTPGGLMKKNEKGWTGAKTEVGENVSLNILSARQLTDTNWN